MMASRRDDMGEDTEVKDKYLRDLSIIWFIPGTEFSVKNTLEIAQNPTILLYFSDLGYTIHRKNNSPNITSHR